MASSSTTINVGVVLEAADGGAVLAGSETAAVSFGLACPFLPGVGMVGIGIGDVENLGTGEGAAGGR